MAASSFGTIEPEKRQTQWVVKVDPPLVFSLSKRYAVEMVLCPDKNIKQSYFMFIEYFMCGTWAEVLIHNVFSIQYQNPQIIKINVSACPDTVLLANQI